MAKAVASGMPKLKIEESAARRQARIDSGKGEGGERREGEKEGRERGRGREGRKRGEGEGGREEGRGEVGVKGYACVYKSRLHGHNRT